MTLEDGRKVVIRNLQDAYVGELNARARYLACAARADQEGLLAPANLFRATAAAEQVHADNHAVVIRSLGCEPVDAVTVPKVFSTRDNLAAAIEDETSEHDAFYPRCIAEAHGNVMALRTFRLAMQAEANHARLFAQALRNLDSGQGHRLYNVCRGCGYTTDKLQLTHCPACGVGNDLAV